MNLTRNVLAGVANSSLTAIVGLLAVPLYLKFLGIENYGLIGFYATAQALLQLLDLGLAPAMNRELARCSALGRIEEGRNLLRTLAVVYWLMALFIVIAVCAAAPFIATHWFNTESIGSESLRNVVMLMGLVVACRWPVGLYQGALMGVHRLMVSSTINTAMVTAGAVGGVCVLAFVSATVEAFFISQAAVAIAHVFAMRAAAWRFVGRDGAGHFNSAALARIWRFSAGMSAIAIASILLMQLDKTLLSKILSLEDFGRYTLAGVVASALYVLLTPVFNVIYPRLTALVASDNSHEVLELYRAGTRLLGSVLFPLAIGIACFAESVVFLWTGNQSLAASVAPIVAVLLVGTSFHGVMIFPYALQLAHGRTDLALSIAVVLAVLLIPAIIVLTGRYGAIGGATAWLLLNSLYLVFGSRLTHRVLFRGQRFAWLSRDVGPPLLISAAIILAGWSLFHAPAGGHLNVLLAGVLILSSMLANFLMLPHALIRRLGRSHRTEPEGS